MHALRNVVFAGPGIPILVDDLVFTLRGQHEAQHGFIPYLTVTNAERIQQLLPAIADLRSADPHSNRSHAAVAARHRLDTKNYNGMIQPMTIVDPDALWKYVRRLEDMEKTWTPEEIRVKLASMPVSRAKRARKAKDQCV